MKPFKRDLIAGLLSVAGGIVCAVYYEFTANTLSKPFLTSMSLIMILFGIVITVMAIFRPSKQPGGFVPDISRRLVFNLLFKLGAIAGLVALAVLNYQIFIQYPQDSAASLIWAISLSIFAIEAVLDLINNLISNRDARRGSRDGASNT